MLDETKTHPNPLLTDEQLASLGGGRVAYLKSVRSEDVNQLFPDAPELMPGLKLFALLAADGKPIVLTDSRDAALANAMENQLQMVSLH
ncbi:DUF1150 family protein [Beijerinckia indica]|uniref:NADH oxidase family protein n=1 Tax=Beijerinckia indica subsp. indica (strain ATCC 9039 / DSM 1715 / NCIMB 8712) TaxID=395963 RepID=B2IEX4_BEII9|nr:DUF1150 domain-containing protein [Beijerinckia indica]ACB94165.1 protein of unknown function DUF1150 [Beijerinckia indica subsp. indica ATCC 9039]